MRVTAILTQTEQKRLDRPVCRAEKRGGRASTARIRISIRPNRDDFGTADTARGEKCLICWPCQATLWSNGNSLGECRVKAFANFRKALQE